MRCPVRYPCVTDLCACCLVENSECRTYYGCVRSDFVLAYLSMRHIIHHEYLLLYAGLGYGKGNLLRFRIPQRSIIFDQNIIAYRHSVYLGRSCR